MPTASFTPESLRFLAQMKRHNDREWFQPRKETFDRVIREPMLALVDTLNDTLAQVSPEYVHPANRILLRIYRDTRFGEDKSPYKQHQGAWWRHGRVPRMPGATTSGGGFYLHLGPTEMVVAAGIFMPTPPQLLAIRNRIAEHPDELRRLLDGKRLRKLLPDFQGNPLTRMPKGFAPGHPAEDLLRCRRFGLCVHWPAERALDPSLARDLATIFRAAAPLVAWLNEPLLTPASSGVRERF
jgi:uncharacterized protein (TIGR02453 family)